MHSAQSCSCYVSCLFSDNPWPLLDGLDMSTALTDAQHGHTAVKTRTIIVVRRCKGAKGPDLPGVLTTAPHSFEGSCEMQCRDPAVLDVSCGGTRDSFMWYVFKGKQGECNMFQGQTSCTCIIAPCSMLASSWHQVMACRVVDTVHHTTIEGCFQGVGVISSATSGPCMTYGPEAEPLVWLTTIDRAMSVALAWADHEHTRSHQQPLQQH